MTTTGVAVFTVQMWFVAIGIAVIALIMLIGFIEGRRHAPPRG